MRNDLILAGLIIIALVGGLMAICSIIDSYNIRHPTCIDGVAYMALGRGVTVKFDSAGHVVTCHE